MSQQVRAAALPTLVRQNLDAFARGIRARFGERVVDIRLFGSYELARADESPRPVVFSGRIVRRRKRRRG